MTRRLRRPVYVAGIVEHPDNCVLIVLPAGGKGETRLWRFPGGPAKPSESPEAAMRRYARETLGVGVEIVVGQPPLVQEVDGREVELRYFFCGVAEGEPTPGPYAEIRWIHRSHLREYEFDVVSKPVVEWLLEERG